MKITLIGAGNVAWHLGPVLLSEGHEIVSVYSRTAAAAETLAQRCQALPVTDTDFRRQPADVFIVAVPDAALETLTPRPVSYTHLTLPTICSV